MAGRPPDGGTPVPRPAPYGVDAVADRRRPPGPGGAPAKSLAHLGVLFLDELPEFQRGALEALRQPLEPGRATIARVNAHVTSPARIQLIAAMNPCPCGFYGDPVKECSCSLSVVSRYKRRISGPLLDRIDLFAEVPRIEYEKLVEEQLAGLPD